MQIEQVERLQSRLSVDEGNRGVLEPERVAEPNRMVESSVFSVAGSDVLWAQLLSGKTSGYFAIPER